LNRQFPKRLESALRKLRYCCHCNCQRKTTHLLLTFVVCFPYNYMSSEHVLFSSYVLV
jgi:hypothetical protein